MKIGDKVTTQQLRQLKSAEWYVLVDLWRGTDGTIAGGVIKYITPTKVKAGDKEVFLCSKGIESITIGGGLTGGLVGEVFVR